MKPETKLSSLDENVYKGLIKGKPFLKPAMEKAVKSVGKIMDNIIPEIPNVDVHDSLGLQHARVIALETDEDIFTQEARIRFLKTDKEVLGAESIVCKLKARGLKQALDCYVQGLFDGDRLSDIADGKVDFKIEKENFAKEQEQNKAPFMEDKPQKNLVSIKETGKLTDEEVNSKTYFDNEARP